jgi:mono/diheme cytochrome c family protein
MIAGARRFLPVPTLPAARAALLLAALAAGGCSDSGPPRFALNLEGRDPKTVSAAQAEAIDETLTKLFGTPEVPKVPEGVPLDPDLLKLAAGRVYTDEEGTQHGLYRQHCVRCHGISGSGAGPAAKVLDPYPRDFRRGWFKYTSTAGGAKPIDADLKRTLRAGVPSTAMPSFAVLSPHEIDALVEYVKYLSIRGETELTVVRLVVDEDEYLPLDMDLVMDEGVEPVALMWKEAPQAAISEEEALRHAPPVDTPELLAASIARGRELYLHKESQCVKCHGRDGSGEGEEPELYDEWNKPKKGVTPEQTAELARLFTLPLQELRPRNFREGTFRGGSRPVDLYWRIDVGIKGTAMPAAGPAPGAKGVLTPEEIWDVVHYVRSLAKDDG